MDASELSATVVGLVLEGKLNAFEVPESALVAPWNKAISLIKDNPTALKDKALADTLLTQCLLDDDIRTAHTVASRHNGLGEEGVFSWVQSAANATRMFNLSGVLERTAKKARTNDTVDLVSLYSEIGTLISGKSSGAKPANDLDYTKFKPYMKSGIPYIDKIIGGIPSDGVIVVIAAQGTGKSYWQFYSICSWLEAHPDKTACIYTLEMPDVHYLARSLKMYPEFTELVKSGRLHISSMVRNVDEIAAEVASKKFGFIGIDAMPQLAKGGMAETYEKIYQTLVEICRFQDIPVQILAQPNRESKKANKFLGIYDAMWSSAAENAASVFITLNYVDPKDPDWQDTRFPVHQGNPQSTKRLFLCFWKFRDERDPEMQQGVGAIRLEPGMNGKYAQIWKGEAYENKLWSPNYQKSTAVSRD